MNDVFVWFHSLSDMDTKDGIFPIPVLALGKMSLPVNAIDINFPENGDGCSKPLANMPINISLLRK